MTEQILSTREPLSTFEEARQYLRVTDRTLRRWLCKREANGLKPIARKLGGQWRFKMKLLLEWEPPQ